MDVCRIPVIFAYLSFGYIIASIIYLIITRSYGTPFSNAIKKFPQLMKIKRDSSSQRWKAFMIGLVIAILILVIWRPFKKCKSI